MVDFPRCRWASWGDVDHWADELARRVRAAGHLPDTLVGVTRGGWVPARLLSDRLGVSRVLSLRAQHWGATATPSGQAQLAEGLSGPVRDQNVLVIDDITDTGESLALATETAARGGAKRVESAAFLHITHSKFVPTYYAEEIPKEAWVWVVFPWNYWEDLATLGERARSIAPTVPGIRTVLKERCGLDVPEGDVALVARQRGWA